MYTDEFQLAMSLPVTLINTASLDSDMLTVDYVVSYLAQAQQAHWPSLRTHKPPQIIICADFHAEMIIGDCDQCQYKCS